MARKVLIIDDEADLCMLLRAYFQKKGFQVSIANTLADGKRLVEEFEPDDVFLDHNLPDGTGWPSAPDLAAQRPNTRFFLISAYNPAEPQLAEGIVYHRLEKPVSFSHLDPFYQ
jgi:DNA-binding response OmpR family regulator